MLRGPNSNFVLVKVVFIAPSVVKMGPACIDTPDAVVLCPLGVRYQGMESPFEYLNFYYHTLEPNLDEKQN